MNNNIFLTPFLTAFFLALVLLLLIVKFFRQKKIAGTLERKTSRHIHQAGISRFGGVGILLAFVATLLLNKELVISSQLLGVLMASGAILVFGIFDDLWQMTWQRQLLFQAGLASFVFLFGIRLTYVTNPFGGIFLFENNFGFLLNFSLVVFWILLIINAMNWVDGIDGVVGGISVIGALAIFFVSLAPQVNQPPVAIIAMALLGASLAFLVFNFNPAKILAGTSGAVFFGFILAILALFAGAKIATTLLVLAIPVIDATWVILERLGAGESIFKADQRHLHHRLLALGWSQKKVCLLYWLITVLIAIAALNFGAFGKVAIFLGAVGGMLAFYVFIQRKSNNHIII